MSRIRDGMVTLENSRLSIGSIVKSHENLHKDSEPVFSKDPRRELGGSISFPFISYRPNELDGRSYTEVLPCIGRK